MKYLIAALLMLSSISSFAGDDIYTCKSGKGIVEMRDLEDGGIVLDLSSHPVIFMDHAYDVFAEIADPRAYIDFVLSLTHENFVVGHSNRFQNSFNKTFLRSAVSENLQTCRITFALNKVRMDANLNYTCSTLFKNTKKLHDYLKCEISIPEVEESTDLLE